MHPQATRNPTQLSELLNRAPQLFTEARISASLRGVYAIDPLPQRYASARTVLLATNRLTTAAGIEQFAQAETISLADNDIASVEAAVAPLVAGCQRLRHLSLAGNPLCRLPWWRERVIDALSAAGISLATLDGAALGPGTAAASASALAHRRAALSGCVAAELEVLQLAALARLVPVHAELLAACHGAAGGGGRGHARVIRALGGPLPPAYASPAAPARLLQAAWSGWDMWRDLGGDGDGGGSDGADALAEALDARRLSPGQARLVQQVEARAAAQLLPPAPQPPPVPLGHAQRLDSASLRGGGAASPPPIGANSQWPLAFERLLALQARVGGGQWAPSCAHPHPPSPRCCCRAAWRRSCEGSSSSRRTLSMRYGGAL